MWASSPGMLDSWLDWFCVVLRNHHSHQEYTDAMALPGPEDYFTAIFLNLWLLQPFHPIFVNVTWATWEGRWCACVIKTEHPALPHSLCSEKLWISVLTAVCCNRSFSDEGSGLLLGYGFKVFGRQFDTKSTQYQALSGA